MAEETAVLTSTLEESEEDATMSHNSATFLVNYETRFSNLPENLSHQHAVLAPQPWLQPQFPNTYMASPYQSYAGNMFDQPQVYSRIVTVIERTVVYRSGSYLVHDLELSYCYNEYSASYNPYAPYYQNYST